jgi:RNA-directed DNA polymerase
MNKSSESLARYTHLGKRRNFLRYAYKAADVMGCPEIRQQVSRHVTWFNRAWEREAVRVFGGLGVHPNKGT